MKNHFGDEKLEIKELFLPEMNKSKRKHSIRYINNKGCKTSSLDKNNVTTVYFDHFNETKSEKLDSKCLWTLCKFWQTFGLNKLYAVFKYFFEYLHYRIG